MKPNFIHLCCFLFLSVVSLADETLVVTHATLIDATGRGPQDDTTIVMTNGVFSAIGETGDVVLPADARIIDAQGRVVIPGLIDCHYHMCYPDERGPFILNEAICSFRAAYYLRKHLLGGITTVVDAGAYHNVGVMVKQAFAEGHLIGSRPIVVGERINATGGHGVSRFDMAYEADGADEFRKAVRVQIKSGADLIKILPPYSRDELAAAIDEAHRLRKRVMVHSGYLQDQYDYVRWAVELNADVIHHAYALPDDVIRAIGEKGLYVVPTMTIMMKNDAAKGIVIDPNKPYKYEIIFQKLKKAGVKMAIGTDALYEFMKENPGLYFDEVERFVKNGYTEHEAMIAATRIGAEVCGAADRLGTIETGKIADLLILNGNPLNDIRHLRDVAVIIQDGKVIDTRTP